MSPELGEAADERPRRMKTLLPSFVSSSMLDARIGSPLRLGITMKLELSPPTSGKDGFQLSRSNKIYFGVIAASLGLVGVMANPRDPFRALGAVTWELGVFFLASWVVGWMVWGFSGGSRKSGRIAFNIVLTLALLIQISQIPSVLSARKKQNQVLSEMERTRAKFQKKAAKAADLSELGAAGDKYVDSITDNLKRLSETSTGPMKPVARILSQLANETVVIAQAWGDSFKAVQSPEFFDWSLLTSDEEFDRRRNLLRLHGENTRAYKEFFDNVVPTLRKRLSVLREDSPYAERVLAGARDAYLRQKPILHPLMQAHIEYSDNLTHILDFLQKNRDVWSYENDEFLISNDSVLLKFNQLFDAAAKNEETINALGLKLLKAQ